MTTAVVRNAPTIAALVAIIVALLLVDLLVFARGRAPTFRESVAWSLGWFALGLAVTLPMTALDGGDGGVNYVTVYLIERTLSLDNLFVFLLIFGAFLVPSSTARCCSSGGSCSRLCFAASRSSSGSG